MPTTTSQSSTAWSPTRSAALQIRKTMLRLGRLSFTFQSHAWPRQQRIQNRREDRDQGEPEQHNGTWHDRPTEFVTSFAPFPVRQLTGPGRVPQSSITVFDSSRFIPDNLYDKIHSEFPGVLFVDHIGGDGRLKAEFKPNAIPYSIKSRNASGLDTTVVEAAYLIDAAILKGTLVQVSRFARKICSGL